MITPDSTPYEVL